MLFLYFEFIFGKWQIKEKFSNYSVLYSSSGEFKFDISSEHNANNINDLSCDNTDNIEQMVTAL